LVHPLAKRRPCRTTLICIDRLRHATHAQCFPLNLAAMPEHRFDLREYIEQLDVHKFSLAVSRRL
jgi:hypothetical protein